MLDFVLDVSHYALPALAVAALSLCLYALLRRRPRPSGSARLVNAADGDVFYLSGGETSIGRRKNCDIVLNYPTVSRVHAVVFCEKSGWYITNIRSASGVTVNGKKIDKKEPIRTGDRITLGGVSLIFENKRV